MELPALQFERRKWPWPYHWAKQETCQILHKQSKTSTDGSIQGTNDDNDNWKISAHVQAGCMGVFLPKIKLVKLGWIQCEYAAIQYKILKLMTESITTPQFLGKGSFFPQSSPTFKFGQIS